MIKIRQFGFLVLLLASVAGCNTNTNSDANLDHWVGTWGASPMGSAGPFGGAPEIENVTLRQVVHTSIAGQQLRIRVSNVFGRSDLVLDSASVALQSDGAGLQKDSQHSLTFSGNSSINIPVGAYVFSDPVPLVVPALSNVSISLFFPGKVDAVTSHSAGLQTSYISRPGDYTASENFPVAEEIESTLFISGVEVAASRQAKLLVTFGDSITDGTGSTVNANKRWPNYLARRFAQAELEVGVINHGIAGNRILHDMIGQNALARFDRDVLSWQNLSHIIVMEGINDLGFSALQGSPFGEEVDTSEVSAEALIAGYRQLISRAHASGVSIIGATLTPFNGAGYYSEAGEAKRQTINAWIRDGGEYDGVIDFDRALRDPNDLTRMQEELHAGDWLHPNDAGYEVMANVVDLGLFD